MMKTLALRVGLYLLCAGPWAWLGWNAMQAGFAPGKPQELVVLAVDQGSEVRLESVSSPNRLIEPITLPTALAEPVRSPTFRPRNAPTLETTDAPALPFAATRNDASPMDPRLEDPFAQANPALHDPFAAPEPRDFPLPDHPSRAAIPLADDSHEPLPDPTHEELFEESDVTPPRRGARSPVVDDADPLNDSEPGYAPLPEDGVEPPPPARSSPQPPRWRVPTDADPMDAPIGSADLLNHVRSGDELMEATTESGERRTMIRRMQPYTVIGLDGRPITRYRPVMIEVDSAEGRRALSSDDQPDVPIDALTVAREPLRQALRAEFERKLDHMTAEELRAALQSLQEEVRELQARQRLETIRRELAAIQQELPDTAPAAAARQMLSIEVPPTKSFKTIEPPVGHHTPREPFESEDSIVAPKPRPRGAKVFKPDDDVEMDAPLFEPPPARTAR